MGSIVTKGFSCDFHCDLCYKENTYIKAVGYCANCKEYLCLECYNYHLKPRPMRHHILLDKQRMPKATSQRQSKDICTELCTNHKDETLKYYCANHEMFCCGACITLHHQDCEDIDCIPDIAADMLSLREYKDMKRQLKALIYTAQQVINTTHSQTKTSHQQHSDASEFFKQLKKDLIAAVVRIETSTMTDLGKIKEENQKMLTFVEGQCNQLLENIEVLDSKFTSLENKGDQCQILFSMKRSDDEITSFETSLQKLKNQSNIKEYVVNTSDDLQDLIQHPEKMTSSDILIKLQPDTEIITGLFHYFYSQSPISSEADVRENEDVPVITGLVVLPGDILVIVDKESQSVKVIYLQESNDIVSHLNLRGYKPWDITSVTNTQVAVVCNASIILFINVTNKLALDHQIKVNGQCNGIASIYDKLVITYLCPVKVEIISQKGELVHTVVTPDRARELLIIPFDVAVSPDQQTLYISDTLWCTVISLDLDGNIKATFRDDELNKPCGLAVDRAGLLYVCGMKSHNIHVLTPDLQHRQILLQKPDGRDGTEYQNLDSNIRNDDSNRIRIFG